MNEPRCRRGQSRVGGCAGVPCWRAQRPARLPSLCWKDEFPVEGMVLPPVSRMSSVSGVLPGWSWPSELAGLLVSLCHGKCLCRGILIDPSSLPALRKKSTRRPPESRKNAIFGGREKSEILGPPPTFGLWVWAPTLRHPLRALTASGPNPFRPTLQTHLPKFGTEEKIGQMRPNKDGQIRLGGGDGRGGEVKG